MGTDRLKSECLRLALLRERVQLHNELDEPGMLGFPEQPPSCDPDRQHLQHGQHLVPTGVYADIAGCDLERLAPHGAGRDLPAEPSPSSIRLDLDWQPHFRSAKFKSLQ